MPKELLMLLGKKKINQPNNNKTVQSILLRSLFWIWTHLCFSEFSPIFVSGMFTQIQNLYCWVIHRDQWDLMNSSIICSMKSQLFVGPRWMDGVGKKLNLLFLMEELLPCRAGRPGSKTQDKTGLLKSWGGLSNSISCWIWFYSAAWCWQIRLFLGAFYPLPKIEVGRSLPVAAFL